MMERSFEYMQTMRIASSRWLWLTHHEMEWDEACFILVMMVELNPGKYKMFDFGGG